jgi:hypothetical protein
MGTALPEEEQGGRALAHEVGDRGRPRVEALCVETAEMDRGHGGAGGRGGTSPAHTLAGRPS